jgi:hypothetical protein
MPPKLLDIRVEIPEAPAPDPDLRPTRVVDAGETDPAERVSHVHFYAAAMAVFVETHQRKKAAASAASSSLGTA